MKIVKAIKAFTVGFKEGLMDTVSDTIIEASPTHPKITKLNPLKVLLVACGITLTAGLVSAVFIATPTIASAGLTHSFGLVGKLVLSTAVVGITVFLTKASIAIVDVLSKTNEELRLDMLNTKTMRVLWQQQQYGY